MPEHIWYEVEYKKPEFSLLPRILNAAVAGLLGVTAVYPLDLVKTRLQSEAAGKRFCSSPIDCLRKVIRKEGYFGIYKGSLPYLLLITPEKAIKLAMNDFYRYHFDRGDGHFPIYKQSLAAALAGISATWITTPMDLLKIDIQNAGKLNPRDPNRRTALTIIKTVYLEKGVPGFYKGFIPTMMRDVAFTSIYFPTFAFLNGLGQKDDNGDTSFRHNFICGLFSGAITAWLVTPIDVMKTRLQLISNIESSIRYTGVFDAIGKIYKNEGVRAFYKGGACRIMVVGPLYAVTQTVYYFKVAERILGL